MENEKCFCHFNGYEVKDAKARQQIQNTNENVNAIHDDINNLSDSINSINRDIQDNVKNTLSSLETSSNTKFGEINNSLEAINDEINELETGLNKIVLFGDSWTDPTSLDAIWGTLIGGVLNLTTHNYAKSGSYLSGEDQISLKAQVDTFISDSEVDKSKVKFIVVLGGINDYRNNVSFVLLAEGLKNQITRLKTSCPQAKVVYISNCQYYYSKEQGDYWCGLHQQLRYDLMIPTLNLFGTMGREMYNTNNYFHLTQVGQRIMLSNIIALLNGGEIQYWEDTCLVTNETGTLRYSTQRVGNMVYLVIDLTPKQVNTFYSFANPEGVYFNYYGIRFGIVGRIKEVGIVNIGHNAIAFDFSSELIVGETYKFTTAIPLQHT